MLLWLPNLVGRIPDQSVMDCWGQKTCRGQPEVKLLRNALWLPNLVWRTPDQSVMLCWGQRLCRVSWSQSEVKLLRNALWIPNFVGRTSDQSAMHCWGHRLCKGQLGSTRGQSAYMYICPIFTKFGRKNPWPNCNALLGQRSCRGQPESIRGQIA